MEPTVVEFCDVSLFFALPEITDRACDPAAVVGNGVFPDPIGRGHSCCV